MTMGVLKYHGCAAQAPWKHPSGSLGMCPSAGSIGGAHLENQDQAVSVLEWRSSSRRSGFAAAEQRIEHEADPRHARRLSKLQISRRRWRAAAGLSAALGSGDRVVEARAVSYAVSL